MKNLFIPTKLIHMKNWWTKDNSGSFNMDLLIRILEIKAQQSC